MDVTTLSWQISASVLGLVLTSGLMLEVYCRLHPIWSCGVSEKATISFVHLLQDTVSARITSIKKIAHDFVSLPLQNLVGPYQLFLAIKALLHTMGSESASDHTLSRSYA